MPIVSSSILHFVRAQLYTTDTIINSQREVSKSAPNSILYLFRLSSLHRLIVWATYWLRANYKGKSYVRADHIGPKRIR